MHQCTIPFDPADGCKLRVTISKAKVMTFNEAEIAASRRQFDFLIDTGASKTAINPSVAKEMGLLVIGQRPLITVSDNIVVNKYLLDLECECFKPAFIFSALEVMDLPNPNIPHAGILGRDFLESFVFEMNGPSRICTLTRVPIS